MQELLTGKRRLDGFREEWKTLDIINNSILKARIGWQGLTSGEYLKEGYSYLVTGTDFFNGKILWNTCHFVNKSRYQQDSNIQLRNGDVLITKDGTIGKIAIIEDLKTKATLNSGIFVLRPKFDLYNSRYVYYVLSSFIFEEFLEKLTAGSTINHLYQKDFNTFQFKAPTSYKEQTAIAEILSDMDAEIDALKAKLNKAKQIKQGMMSELLTGRIRLIEEKPVSQETEVKSTTARTNSHSKAFEDAVLYAAIVEKFYTPNSRYPLGRKKIQKCLYLLRCHLNLSTDDFKKKAAGPYAASMRYSGGEKVAQTKGYIIEHKSKKGSCFELGVNYDEALHYLECWGLREGIQWLTEHLKFRKVDDLELLATVDRCIRELLEAGLEINVATIKQHLENIPEWAAKLKKTFFSDKRIQDAIDELRTLLGKTYVKHRRK